MISVAIITKNEEANIERCVRSVLWCDEIIVVDAESSDKTRLIAENLGARVFVKSWEGYSQQKKYALQQTSSEWVLSLDADEEVTLELKNEIVNTVSSKAVFNGYHIPRKSFFLGKWIRNGGWYPGYQLRLFRKSKTTMHHRPVHEGFEVSGEIGRLVSDINHYTYHSIHHYLDKMNDYSSLDVMNKISPKRHIHWYNFILNPFSAFLRMYFSLRGYKDGFAGFLLSMYSALHVLVIYSKMWEYQIAEKNNTELPPVSHSEIILLKDLRT